MLASLYVVLASGVSYVVAFGLFGLQVPWNGEGRENLYACYFMLSVAAIFLARSAMLLAPALLYQAVTRQPEQISFISLTCRYSCSKRKTGNFFSGTEVLVLPPREPYGLNFRTRTEVIKCQTPTP